MISKIVCNIKKQQLGRKIGNEGYLLLLLHINRSITKKFPIETLLEMIDSCVKSHGEVEYDKQNWLQHQTALVQLNIQNEVYHLLPLFINWSITKYFLTKTLLEMTDSTCPRFLMLESVLSEIVLIGNFFGMDCFRFMKRSNRR
jgi:hypothetical protein